LSIKPFLKLENITTEISKISGEYLDNIKEEKEKIFENIKSKTINLMFFGAYNAGKSTMINALLSEEKARINDIPTTDKIDKYNWNGFILIDSPGVNAPIEHEEISQAEIERSNLIVFIIRGGDQDTKDIYERMFSFLRENKKVFIVLNYDNNENIYEFTNKINENILNLNKNYNVQESVIKSIPIIPINAKTALKARLEKKDRLLEHSQYLEFEREFEDWLEKYNAEYHLIDSIKKQIENTLLNPTLDFLTNKKNENSNLELLNANINELSMNKLSFIQEVYNKIDYAVYSKKERIIDSFRGNSGGIDSVVNEILGEIEKLMKTKMDNINLNMDNFYNSKNIPADESEGEDNIKSFINQSIDMGAKGFSENAEKIVFKGLMQGRKMKIPILKGRWEKTFGKWAGKAAIPIQIAIEFGMAIKGVIDQNKENDKQRTQELSFHQVAESQIHSLQSELKNTTNNAINESFDEKEGILSNSIELISKEINGVEADIQNLQQLKNRLNEVVI